MTKYCPKCNQTKQIDEFHRNKARHDGRKAHCKSCTKARHVVYYAENTEKWKERREAYKARNRDFLRKYLESHPCVDCNESDIVVLEFDHLRDKEYNIARLMNHSLATIEKEIAKCEVVCANCHKRRTAQSQAWWKAT